MYEDIVFTFRGKRYSVPFNTYKPEIGMNYIVLPDRTTIAVQSWTIIPNEIIAIPPDEEKKKVSPEAMALSWLGVVAEEVVE